MQKISAVDLMCVKLDWYTVEICRPSLPAKDLDLRMRDQMRSSKQIPTRLCHPAVMALTPNEHSRRLIDKTQRQWWGSGLGIITFDCVYLL